MTRAIQLIGGYMLLFAACSYKQSPKVSMWQISYHRADYFFGCIDIKIGMDSCYYLNQESVHKNPPIIKWKSCRKKLNELYTQVEKFKLQDCSAVLALVTEQPFESITLLEDGKIVYEILKHQQNNRDVGKFESVLAILKTFVSKENEGGTY